jgi:TnpA family transposase
MPRRRALTPAQLDELFALPTAEPDLISHWTLSTADLAAIDRRRERNRLAFALHLCALRFPGRILRAEEVIPPVSLRFVAEQLGAEPEAMTTTAFHLGRKPLAALREAFGFVDLTMPHRREMLERLSPVALATTSAATVATALVDELRRRRIILPPPALVERVVLAAMLVAERRLTRRLTRDLPTGQAEALEALLAPKDGTALSVLAWARQPPGPPGHRALLDVTERLAHLRAIGLDPARADGVHPERLRQLAREGGRFTAQHLRALSPPRRRATLIATVLDTATRLTDDGIALFDRAVGRLFRRAEARVEDAVLRDARAVNDKVRLFARLGEALLAARETGADPLAAVETAVGWERLSRGVAEARRLVRPDKADLPALAQRAWPVLHRLGPPFLRAFRFRAVPAAVGTLRAVEILAAVYRSGGQDWPDSLPVGFLKPAWRNVVLTPVGMNRRAWEVAALLALRDRLRAGDLWVEGSRQWRAVEDQLMSPTIFRGMRRDGRLPVAVPATAAAYLQERRDRLGRRLAEVADQAEREALSKVRIRGAELKITPLDAVTPEAAEAFARRLYGMLPSLRITDLLAEVDRWIGLSADFTHLHSGLPADDPRVVLTAVLADATNLGLTRMAEACHIASYRRLAWVAGWHLREETYRRALARLVAAQQREPLAAAFGTGTVSSSDGQHFLTAGRGEAVGGINARTGREPAVSVYTHLSDRFAPYAVQLIPATAGEAPHVIDGLLHREADPGILTHHTDGGGVSEHTFGLAHLLGFRFAPRIPDLAGRKLYAFAPAATWPALAALIAGRVDEGLIAAHWEDLLRLAGSVRTGVASASLLLRRLGAYPRQNGLALALREVGRIERTLFTLDWLEMPDLRRQATAELNKGEARHALARAVCELHPVSLDTHLSRGDRNDEAEHERERSS